MWPPFIERCQTFLRNQKFSQEFLHTSKKSDYRETWNIEAENLGREFTDLLEISKEVVPPIEIRKIRQANPRYARLSSRLYVQAHRSCVLALDILGDVQYRLAHENPETITNLAVWSSDETANSRVAALSRDGSVALWTVEFRPTDGGGLCLLAQSEAAVIESIVEPTIFRLPLLEGFYANHPDLGLVFVLRLQGEKAQILWETQPTWVKASTLGVDMASRRDLDFSHNGQSLLLTNGSHFTRLSCATLAVEQVIPLTSKSDAYSNIPVQNGAVLLGRLGCIYWITDQGDLRLVDEHQLDLDLECECAAVVDSTTVRLSGKFGTMLVDFQSHQISRDHLGEAVNCFLVGSSLLIQQADALKFGQESLEIAQQARIIWAEQASMQVLCLVEASKLTFYRVNTKIEWMAEYFPDLYTDVVVTHFQGRPFGVFEGGGRLEFWDLQDSIFLRRTPQIVDFQGLWDATFLYENRPFALFTCKYSKNISERYHSVVHDFQNGLVVWDIFRGPDELILLSDLVSTGHACFSDFLTPKNQILISIDKDVDDQGKDVLTSSYALDLLNLTLPIPQRMILGPENPPIRVPSFRKEYPFKVRFTREHAFGLVKKSMYHGSTVILLLVYQLSFDDDGEMYLSILHNEPIDVDTERFIGIQVSPNPGAEDWILVSDSTGLWLYQHRLGTIFLVQQWKFSNLVTFGLAESHRAIGVLEFVESENVLKFGLLYPLSSGEFDVLKRFSLEDLSVNGVEAETPSQQGFNFRVSLTDLGWDAVFAVPGQVCQCHLGFRNYDAHNFQMPNGNIRFCESTPLYLVASNGQHIHVRQKSTGLTHQFRIHNQVGLEVVDHCLAILNLSGRLFLWDLQRQYVISSRLLDLTPCGPIISIHGSLSPLYVVGTNGVLRASYLGDSFVADKISPKSIIYSLGSELFVLDDLEILRVTQSNFFKIRQINPHYRSMGISKVQPDLDVVHVFLIFADVINFYGVALNGEALLVFSLKIEDTLVWEILNYCLSNTETDSKVFESLGMFKNIPGGKHWTDHSLLENGTHRMGLVSLNGDHLTYLEFFEDPEEDALHFRSRLHSNHQSFDILRQKLGTPFRPFNYSQFHHLAALGDAESLRSVVLRKETDLINYGFDIFGRTLLDTAQDRIPQFLLSVYAQLFINSDQALTFKGSSMIRFMNSDIRLFRAYLDSTTLPVPLANNRQIVYHGDFFIPYHEDHHILTSFVAETPTLKIREKIPSVPNVVQAETVFLNFYGLPDYLPYMDDFLIRTYVSDNKCIRVSLAIRAIHMWRWKKFGVVLGHVASQFFFLILIFFLFIIRDSVPKVPSIALSIVIITVVALELVMPVLLGQVPQVFRRWHLFANTSNIYRMLIILFLLLAVSIILYDAAQNLVRGGKRSGKEVQIASKTFLFILISGYGMCFESLAISQSVFYKALLRIGTFLLFMSMMTLVWACQLYEVQIELNRFGKSEQKPDAEQRTFIDTIRTVIMVNWFQIYAQPDVKADVLTSLLYSSGLAIFNFFILSMMLEVINSFIPISVPKWQEYTLRSRTLLLEEFNHRRQSRILSPFGLIFGWLHRVLSDFLWPQPANPKYLMVQRQLPQDGEE